MTTLTANESIITLGIVNNKIGTSQNFIEAQSVRTVKDLRYFKVCSMDCGHQNYLQVGTL